MLSDGLTKGSVARSLIDKAMGGEWALTHTPKVWQSTLATRKETPATLKPSQEEETVATAEGSLGSVPQSTTETSTLSREVRSAELAAQADKWEEDLWKRYWESYDWSGYGGWLTDDGPEWWQWYR